MRVLLLLLCTYGSDGLALSWCGHAVIRSRTCKHARAPPQAIVLCEGPSDVSASSSLADLRNYVKQNGLDIKTSGAGRTKAVILAEILTSESDPQAASSAVVEPTAVQEQTADEEERTSVAPTIGESNPQAADSAVVEPTAVQEQTADEAERASVAPATGESDPQAASSAIVEPMAVPAQEQEQEQERASAAPSKQASKTPQGRFNKFGSGATPTPAAAAPGAPRGKGIRTGTVHGVTLKEVLEVLVQRHGWSTLGRAVPIQCFRNEPSIGSSLRFLRKTEWARAKVERLYTHGLPKEFVELPSERW